MYPLAAADSAATASLTYLRKEEGDRKKGMHGEDGVTGGEK